MASMQMSGSVIGSFEKDHPKSYSCTISTCLLFLDDRLVEDVVSMFGLCHQRWTTPPPSLNLGFNSRGALSLSSVPVNAYIQLNPMHTLCAFSGQTVGRATHRASTGPNHYISWPLKIFKCGNFTSDLSADERMQYGSICDLQHLHEFISTSYCAPRHLSFLLYC
jgi:hypothetical protein